MKKIILLFFVLSLDLLSFEYISPLPNSINNSTESPIIVRFGSELDPHSLNSSGFSIVDSEGQSYSGELVLSSDKRTLVFYPDKQLKFSSLMTVNLNNPAKTTDGKWLERLEFKFSTVKDYTDDQRSKLNKFLNPEIVKNSNTLLSDTLPADFPVITVNVADNPSPGAIFMANTGTGYGTYLMILDSAGKVIKYKKLTRNASNFAVQPCGLITYNQSAKAIFKAYSEAKIFIADTSLNILDSIIKIEGLAPAPHVSTILPNGHILYSSYEAYNVDMSKVVPNGNPNALVAGAILCELDADKNMVFKWRTWDHISVEDSYQPMKDFQNITTLYSNFNSVDVDFYGNYLVSNRLLSEITKIDRFTGNIIWRLGGKYNQFTFINDREEYKDFHFSMQHDIRHLPNGNITLYDNGDQHNPPQSRAIEFALDETNKTATLVWEHRSDPLLFAAATGSTQRLPNDNTIIGWGSVATEPKTDVLEVRQDHTKALELVLPKGITSFKALKFKYPIGMKSASVRKNELNEKNTYIFDSNNEKTGVSMIFSYLEGFMYNYAVVDKYNYAPKYPRFSGQAPHMLPYKYEVFANNLDTFNVALSFKVSDLEWAKYPDLLKVYHRDTASRGTFAQLPTIYNSATNELTVNVSKFGEFAFGIPAGAREKPAKPYLNYPVNEAKVLAGSKINLQWSPKGNFMNSDIQVATDKDFVNIISNQNDLKQPLLSLTLSATEQTYYWRARVKNSYGISEWSDIWSFEAGRPFMIMNNPINNEIIKVGKTNTNYIVYWDDNINDKVKIELLKNGDFYKLLADSLVTGMNAFVWTLNDSIPEDSSYKIKVTAIDGSGISAESDGNFRVVHDYTSAEEPLSAKSDLMIFPNPATVSINYSVNLNQSGYSLVKLFDISGNIIKVVSLGYLDNGSYISSMNLSDVPPGIYYLSFVVNGTPKTVRFVKI